MGNKKKAEKQVASFEAFKQVFVESERVMRDNLIKLIEQRLKDENTIDGRLAFKIAIKIIRTGTLEDVDSIDISTDLLDVKDGDESEPQGKGSDL